MDLLATTKQSLIYALDEGESVSRELVLDLAKIIERLDEGLVLPDVRFMGGFCELLWECDKYTTTIALDGTDRVDYAIIEGSEDSMDIVFSTTLTLEESIPEIIIKSIRDCS